MSKVKVVSLLRFVLSDAPAERVFCDALERLVPQSPSS